MSLYDKASLIQIPSGYKPNSPSTGKLYSVIPNTIGGDFRVDTPTSATRVNKFGVIERVDANQARLSYDPTNPTDPYLLLEPTRTNYIQYSQDFKVAEWQERTAGSTIEGDTTDTLAPDNTYSACKMTRSSLGFGEASMHHAPSTNGTVVASFFAKKGNANYAYLRLYNKESQKFTNGSYIIFDIENGTVSSSSNYGTGFTASNFEVTEYKNGWYRCSAKVVTPTINSIKYLVGVSSTGSNTNADFGDYAYFWGCQMEKSSRTAKTDYVSSYIPTLTTTSRAADLINEGGTTSIINSSSNEGTVFIDLKIPFDTTSQLNEYFKMTILEDSNASNRVELLFQNGTAGLNVFSRGSLVGNVSTSVTKNTRLKIAASYKTNEFRLYVNGTQSAFDGSGVVDFNDDFNGIHFSDGSPYRSKFQADVYQMMYFDEALTQSELATLTQI